MQCRTLQRMETTPPQNPPTEPIQAPAPRRLTRAADDRYAGGVAGGLARYFGVDPVIPRIAFAVTTFVGGFGILAYVLAWIFVPGDPGPTTYAWRNGDRSGRAILARVALAIAAVVVVVTVMFAVGLASALGGDVIVALVVIACGALVALGAAFGRGRWLVVPAILIALPAGVVAAADLDVSGGVGEREYTPTSVSALDRRYELGMGQLRIDLREVDFGAGATTLKARVGVGHLLVLVDEGLCVQPSIDVGAGYAGVLDRESAGLDVVLDEPMETTAGAPRLVLDAAVGMGAVEVTDDEKRYFDHHDEIDGELAPEGTLGSACAGGR